MQIWFSENAKAHDFQFLDNLLALAPANTLLILDRGFYDFEWWAKLAAKHVQVICAAKSNLAYTVVKPFSLTHGLKDRLIDIPPEKWTFPMSRS